MQNIKILPQWHPRQTKGLFSESMTANALLFLPSFWVKLAVREAEESTDIGLLVDYPMGNSHSAVCMNAVEVGLKYGVRAVALTYPYGAHRSGMDWPKILMAMTSKKVHQEAVFLWMLIDVDRLPQTLWTQAVKWMLDAGVDGLLVENLAKEDQEAIQVLEGLTSNQLDLHFL
ncbi:hypothetical protein [Persicobacter psychrovividus]|uniref:Deoxyribose-phosphate aldolase n=1 Tax=Persicobacter psychrovividus TaxID=387638 RepID=A0ABM7VBU2_9BACT|nr:hypothetical protein PEPS_04790 [Persicobacter psychrovividus]